ncbi:hypothetical protein [Bradyrhizobium japonicum]|uniref:hypothetical protein n=1 Tax=Bradyrhizobium japonicum TaxID=375 RepID=UPI002714C4A9|nr:hypothetical protein [Bradyrhizobium japonicum]WLB58020.1 hypothetical protein QIH94_19125 [Bradyrhizobium japonicum]WLB60113.1 hypothetical protein QIH96_26815 [Bradyrhizobium japonicum]
MDLVAASTLEWKQTGAQVPSELPATPAGSDQLGRWIGMQARTAVRHAAAIRPFVRGEFGDSPASPGDAHLEAANELTRDLRVQVLEMSRQMVAAARAAIRSPGRNNMRRLLETKEGMLHRVRRTEDIWKFYLELFNQRQTRYGPMLLACDRIALDCYQYVYTGLGRARPVPSPAPFCYMEAGFSPATYGRGSLMPRLGRRRNPFPLIQLPHHRLQNPWTLGAVLHESGHNLQNDLGLCKAVPLTIAQKLLSAGFSPRVAKVWARWNRETWADLIAVLLGGPEIVASLMDVAARSPQSTQRFSGADVHPTPWLRVLINIELLRRMGFEDRAREFTKAWDRLYGQPEPGWIPRELLATFPQARDIVVDAIACTSYQQLGNQSLAKAFLFGARDQAMVEEAARRLAASRDPGIVPAIFLIGAARHALDRRWASPGAIARNFYRALVKR